MANYFSKYDPDTYFVGDGARQDGDGYYWLLGRIDDVMNVSGHRLSTIELESALVAHEAVAEAAAAAAPDDLTGQTPLCFVILESGYEPSDELAAELREWVGEQIGKIARPKAVIFGPTCRRRAPERSCAACSRTSPRDRTSGTRPRCATRRSSSS